MSIFVINEVVCGRRDCGSSSSDSPSRSPCAGRSQTWTSAGTRMWVSACVCPLKGTVVLLGSGYLAWRGKSICSISVLGPLLYGRWPGYAGIAGTAGIIGENGPKRMQEPRSGSTAATGSSRSVSPQIPTKLGVIRSWTLWFSSYGSIKTSDGKPCKM